MAIISDLASTLLIIDPQVEDYQSLVAGAISGAIVSVLDPDRDGVEQSIQAISQSAADRVHIISHGSPGCLYLGNSQLSLETLDRYASALQARSISSLFLYGCNVAAGDAGAEFIDKLHRLMDAEIAASTTPIGNAERGGNWQLDASTNSLASASIFTARTLATYAGVFAATPTTNLILPEDPLLGEDFSFTVTFENTGDPGDAGFGPFVNLILDTTGADGAGTEPDDGITFNGATFLGTPVTAIEVVFDASGMAEHPLAVDNTGAPVVLNAADFGAEPGDTLVVLQLPFSSIVPGQPAAEIEVSASVSNLADVATPLNIVSQGGFQFGNDAADNPAADPSILGASDPGSISPQAFTVTKSVGIPEAETVTGPNFPTQFTIAVDIPDGQTIDDLVISDLLEDGANDLQFVAIDSVMVGGAAVPLGDLTIAAPSTTTPGGTLSVELGDVMGTTSAADAVLTFSAFVPRINADGDEILAANTGTAVGFTNTGTVAGVFDPADSRDDPPTPLSVEATATFSEQAIAVQKSVVNLTDSENTPGDVLQYTIEFQISDFFVFENLAIEDIFSDGQILDSGFAPTLTVNERDVSSSGTFDLGSTFTVSAFDPADGSTTINFDISQELIDRGEAGVDGVLSGGGIPIGGTGTDPLPNNPPLPFDGTTGTIVFQTVILDEFNVTPASGDISVDQGDVINNDATISGDLLDVTDEATALNASVTDGTSAGVTISGGAFDKSIFAINGDTGLPATTNLLSPGDTVTYRLNFTLPSSDVEGLTLTDFLPLPAFDVNEFVGASLDTTPSGTPPVAGGIQLGPDDTFFALYQTGPGPDGIAGNADDGMPELTIDAASNSLSLFFGDFDDPNNTPSEIDLLLTATVSEEPFADGLVFTNQAVETENNSGAVVAANADIVQIVLGQPELNITQGVVAIDATSQGAIAPAGSAPTGVTFNAPGTVGPRFTGTITSDGLADTPIDSNLVDADAGDLVTFAVAIENTGSSRFGAFDVLVEGEVPDGFVVPTAGANIQVFDGTGASIAFTGDFLAGGIELSDPGPTPADAMDGTNGGAIDAFDATSGTNIAIVTFDLQLDTSVEPTETIANVATLEDFSNLEGGDSFLPGTEALTDDATVEIENVDPEIEVVATSETFTAGTAVAIGEIVRYRLITALPEGSATNFTLDSNLQNGLMFLNDGTAEFAFVSDGGGISSSTLGNANQTGDENTDLDTITFTQIPASAITNPSGGTVFNSGTDPFFNLGDLTNNDSDANQELIVVEFNALVNNTGVNNAGVNRNNSFNVLVDGDTLANSGNTGVQIDEPAIDLTKDADVSTADAGDTVTFTVTFTNDDLPSGQLTNAFDIEFSDLLPSSFTNVTLVSADLEGTDISSSFVVNGNEVATAAPLAQLDPNETVTLVYTAELIAAVTPGTIDSDATVTFTSLPGTNGTAVNDTGSVVPGVPGSTTGERTGSEVGVNDLIASDGAPVEVAVPAAKTVTATNQAFTGAIAGGANDGEETVAIGEIVTYQVVLDIPEGSLPNSVLVDDLPAGLAVVSLDSLTPSSAVVTTDAPGGFAGALSNAAITDSGGQFAIDLGNISNADTNNGTVETLTLVYQAVVLDIPANDDGDTLTNAVEFSVDGTTVTTAAVDVNVVEPEIAVSQTIDVVAGDDANDPVTFTIEIENTGNTDAFEIDLADVLPAGVTFVGSLMNTDGVAPDTLTETNGTISATFATLAPGETSTITFEAALSEDTPAVDNTVDVNFSSLSGTVDMPQSTFNTASTERVTPASNTDSVDGVNDAPTNTVPGAQMVDEDTPLALDGAISIGDPDAGADGVQVTLGVDNGTLTLGDVTGLTFVDGTANGESVLTFTGTVADINAALGDLDYQGNLNFNGSDTLTVTTNDLGNAGTGGAMEDVDAIAIQVNPVNDAPVINGGVNVLDVSVPEGAIDVATITATDVDNLDGDLTFSITGGADADAFEIDPDTGELVFLDPPDFEMPGDADEDNVFELEITVTDPDGLPDVLATTVTVTDIDDTAPGAPTVIIEEDLDDDEFINEGELDGDINITVELPDDAVAGDTLEIDDGMMLQSIMLSAADIAEGSVMVTIPAPAEGTELTVTANLTDAAGNVGPDDSDSATIDTVVGIPTVIIAEDDDNNGLIGAGELAGDIDVTVALPDDAAIGDILAVTDGVVSQSFTLTAADIANASVMTTFAPPDEGIELTVSANLTDEAGNTSQNSSDSATLDTIAPDAPTVTIDEDLDNDELIGEAELEGDVNVTVALPANAVAGDILLIDDGDMPQMLTLTVEDIDNGSVMATFAAPEDGTELTVIANITDDAGNTSLNGSDSATLDAVADSPTVIITEDADNNSLIGAGELDGEIDVTILLPDDAAIGDILEIDDGATPQTFTLTAENIADGSVMATVPVPAEGTELTVTANITDDAGNTSSNGSDSATLDTVADAPIVIIAEDSDDNDFINNGELDGDINITVELPDDAVAGDILLIDDGVMPQMVTLTAEDIDNGSVMAIVPVPAEGTELTVSANITDAAGNTSPDSSDSATLDTIVGTPTVVIDEDDNNDGLIGAAELAGDIDVTVNLPEDAAVGDTLVVTDGITPQTFTLTAADIANASVTATFAPPAEGAELTVSANLTDAAGNTSSDSSDSATLDTIAPNAPTVAIAEDANDDGVIDPDELDGDIDLTIGLPEDAVAGNTLTITDGITPQTIVLSEADIAAGSITATFPAPEDDTELTLSVSVTDAAGNTSPEGSDSALLDAAAGAPTIAIDEDTDGDGIIDSDELDGDVDVTVGLPIDAVVGDTLTVTDGITPQTIVLSEEDIAAGIVTAAFPAPAEGTELTIGANVTNAAGNVGPDGNDSATVDTVAGAPTVTIDEDANNDGVIDEDELDGDVDVTVGLPADAAIGDTLVVTDGITPQTIVLSEADIAAGSVAATFPAPASGTELTIDASLTDVVGNVSPEGSDSAAIAIGSPPAITSAPEVAIEAGQTAVTVVTATDADPDDVLTFDIVGGDDAGAFSIDPDTGELSFITAPDFENPGDIDGDNSFELQVAVTDAAGNVDLQTLSITVGDGVAPAPPDIDIATFVVLENTTAVTVLSATDPNSPEGDVLSFSITGGDDADAFSIDPATGELSFITAPDFENPSDIDGDNVFDLEITVTDSTGLTDLLDATVTVVDVPEDGDPDDQPNVVDDQVDAAAGEAVAIDVLANDSDPNGNPLTITAVTQPTQGTAEIDDNGTPDDPSDDFVVFTPDAGAGADDLSLGQSDEEDGILQLGGDLAAFTDSFTVTIADADGNTATSTVNATVNPQASLEFTLLESNALCHNEVGVYVTDDAAGTIDGIAPGEAGYTEAALSAGQVIFSAMPGVSELFGEAPNRILDGFDASDNLGFFLIQNDTTDSVLLDIESGNDSAEVFFAPVAANSDNAEHVEVSSLASGNGFTLAFEDQLGGGDNDFNDLVFAVELTDEAPILGTEFQGGQEGELLSLLSSGPVTAEFAVESDAGFDNTVGFYAIDDVSGAIAGADGALLAPGDAGYAEAAVANAVTVFGEEGTTVDLAGDVLLAPFLISDGTVADFEAGAAEAFFAFVGANTDGFDHIRLFGDNTFGFEDQVGGGDADFNDFVLQATFV